MVLVDGSSYLYRAFHAMPKLTNSRGEHTGAVYGVANMLRKLLSDYEPEYIAVVFDAPGKTFRDAIYEEYKANRPPMPAELSAQIGPLYALVRAMGLTLLQVEGVEADDVIATLATQATDRGMDTVISTGDKDLAQLVSDHVTLIDTMTGTTYDRAGVIGKFGVPPERIVDYLALVGDSVDNIPGVPKVGPKTATQWLQQYGSLDAIEQHAGEIGGKAGENLRASFETVRLSQRLATVDRHVKLDLAVPDLQRREPDAAQLRQLYMDLEFRSWLANLGGINRTSEVTTGNASYDTILELAQLDRWIERLRAAPLFAVDTETTDLDVMNAELVGLSFTDHCGQGAYVPIGHTGPGTPTQLDRKLVLQKLKSLFEDDSRKKVGQNLKYDLSILSNHGIDLRGIEFDTMLESYVLDSTGSRHDMDSLALKYLGYKTVTYEDVTGKGKNQINFSEVPLDRASHYAAEDADITLRLHESLWPRLQELPSLAKLFREIEMPLVPVLSRIERHGVRIDTDMLRRQSGELAHRLAELEQEAYRIAGQPFNLASPLQIQEVLFNQLKLPVLKKTPKGQPSTAEEVLQELSIDYPLPRVILEYRGIAKLKSTYTDKLPDMVNPRTGRVHTSYHQAVAATGRLSSSDPNLQNIPVRTAEGRRIRQAFVPEDGNLLLSADYSQIELRIMAHLSGDRGLLAAFEQGSDVHRATAAEVFGMPPEQVTDEMRRNAKAINFGLIYGMSAFGLAQQLRIDRGAAQAYIDLYFARYPAVKEFMDRTRAQAHATGYVETVFGRRLYLPEINTANQARRQYAERTAINAPMQGTAADLIKLAMLAVDAWILDSGIRARMIMQVHDELVFEIPETELETVSHEIRRLMTGAAQFAVPLVVDIGSGRNWDQAH